MGYSQTRFAALGNSSKGSQIAWEKGDAFPNASVLAAWVGCGVDVVYVLTGEPEKQRATWHVLLVIQEFLKLTAYDKELEDACRLAYDELKSFLSSGSNENKTDQAIFALLRNSPVLMLDEALFEDMLEKLEFVLETKNLNLSPASKARAILQVYKAVQTGGQRVELKMIEAAIKAAL